MKTIYKKPFTDLVRMQNGEPVMFPGGVTVKGSNVSGDLPPQTAPARRLYC